MSTPDEDAAAAKAAADKAEQDKKTAEAAAAKAKATADDEALGDGGKAALAAERRLREDADKARKAAEKAARDAQAKLDKLEAEKLSETEREKKRADDAEQALGVTRSRVRDANLRLALQATGVAHPAAAARLLDGVEYDDQTDEPTNLDAAVKAATATFGDDMFKPARARAADINGGAGAGTGDGPRLTAEEQQAARGFGQSDAEYAWYRDNPTDGVYKPAEVKT